MDMVFSTQVRKEQHWEICERGQSSDFKIDSFLIQPPLFSPWRGKQGFSMPGRFII